MATDSAAHGGGQHGGGAGAGAAAGLGLVGIIGAISLAAIAIALFLMQQSVSEQTCIRKAEAQYPTVPVSAFVSGERPQTGPLKVSFGKERSDAVKAC